METKTRTDADMHRALGKELFNHTWRLLETGNRTREQDDEMIHAAHASRFHWGRVGGAVELCRGEWQISRVYSVLGRGEPAVHHARRCLDIVEGNGIGGFDVAAANEGLARAYATLGDIGSAREHARRARGAGATIDDEEDRRIFEGDMATLPSGIL